MAKLVKLDALPDSNVDAAVAEVIPGMVSGTGQILEIGTISAQIAAPALKKAVKKSAMNGLTRSSIVGLNAQVQVAFDNECAGGQAFVKTFTGQVVVSNKGGGFIKGGDSGAVMVEDVANRPRAVGLLYAGSNSYAIANPIGEVLAFVGGKLGGSATMVSD